MPFKLNDLSWLYNIKPINISLSLHLGIVGLVFIVFYWNPTRENVEFEVYEYPVVTEAPVAAPKPIEPERVQESKPVKEGVFGTSKKTVTADVPSEGVAIKKGNTVAKEFDDKELKDDDPDSLPIPTAEYAVSAMPSLISEVRVKYPPEAKANSIEGPVVMDLLIDDKGRVRKADLIQGPGFGLNEAALKAVMKFKFKPAFVDKKPVAVIVRYTYRFVLE